MTFDFQTVTFRLVAREPITFDACGSGNWLRGAFGSALREIACSPDCPSRAGFSIRRCPNDAACTYARIFEPVSRKGPSGLADPPRPFVFRLAHLANRSLAQGDEFSFQVNFFDTSGRDLDDFARAFERLARAKLVDTESTFASTSLDEPINQPARLCVQFLTPTELKGSGSDRFAFDFATLFARARDRVSTLRALYGPGPLDIDFRGLGERAKSIRTLRTDLRRVSRHRRSGRSSQIHDIGGFTGVAEYDGAVAEFLPILQAARSTGVGRHCVWGNGEIVAVAN